MKLAIIDYDAGNTRSVINALDRLGVENILTDNLEEILAADRVILPGVGHAASAMKILKNKRLVEGIKRIKQPFLGICLGMQIMMDRSEEGDTECLGLVSGTVKLFDNELFKVPKMGWNNLKPSDSPLFKGIDKEDYFYFVHSYYVPFDESYTIASTDYILEFSAAIQKDNFFGTQFHPEKSGEIGEKILQNFLDI